MSTEQIGKLQYLLVNMDYTAVRGVVLMEQRTTYSGHNTFRAFDTAGEYLFRRKSDVTTFEKVAHSHGLRVIALGYFGVQSEATRKGMSAPEYMRAAMEEGRWSA